MPRRDKALHAVADSAPGRPAEASRPDGDDIANGTRSDCDGNDVPDEYQIADDLATPTYRRGAKLQSLPANSS